MNSKSVMKNYLSFCYFFDIFYFVTTIRCCYLLFRSRTLSGLNFTINLHCRKTFAFVNIVALRECDGCFVAVLSKLYISYQRNYYLFSILAIILCSTTDSIWAYCSLERFFARLPRFVFPRSSFTDDSCNEFCRELFLLFSKMSTT